jgi:hypothetical protein
LSAPNPHPFFGSEVEKALAELSENGRRTVTQTFEGMNMAVAARDQRIALLELELQERITRLELASEARITELELVSKGNRLTGPSTLRFLSRVGWVA